MVYVLSNTSKLSLLIPGNNGVKMISASGETALIQAPVRLQAGFSMAGPDWHVLCKTRISNLHRKITGRIV
jgi:hypothetical protein